MVRYPLVVLVEQGRLSQAEAARDMGISTRQVAPGACCDGLT